MKKKKISTIKNNLYFLRLIWKICPSRVVLNFLNVFFDFAMWTFYSVIFMQYLFGAGENMRSFTEVAVFIWFAAGMSLVAESFNAWYENCFVPQTDIKIHYQLNTMLFQKVRTVDLSCYEDPEFYNTYTKAVIESGERTKSVLDHCAKLAASCLSSVFVIWTMCRITPWTLAFVALPLVGNLYVGKKRGKVVYDLEQESIPAKRRMDYVNRVVYFRKYSGELRLSNVFCILQNIYTVAMEETLAVARKYAFKKSWLSWVECMLMYVLGFEGMWLCAAVLGIMGKIALGDVVVLVSAIVSVSWMLVDVDVENAITQILTNAFFIENLKQFFDYVPKIDESAGGKMPPKQVDIIEFQNVSFRYQGQEGYALQGINLTLKRGVRHALVGINGSGKSTLIKLLMRFYDPSEGVILLNGVDIREYDIRQYRRLMGAAFQDFALFAATVLENVILREAVDSADRETAIAALIDSDVYEKIRTLQYGEDTVLTREFDNEGVELSGGEKQKIAIARAFAGNTPVVILDEPSSALDPIAEYKMFETITRLCKGEHKLSVIVSHRLSSAAVCEKIFVFEKGRLLEQGSHGELMAADGIYASMFRKQARNYQTEEETADV